MSADLKERSQRIAEVDYDVNPQTMRAVEKCNLCKSSQFVILTHRDRYDYPVSAAACRNCGLVFLNPVMTPESYQQFYSEVYRPLVSAYHGRLINAETVQVEQATYAQELVRFLAPFIQRNRHESLLDIGGSTGVVSHNFVKEFGLRATVLDPSPDELAKAEQTGLSTVAGFLEDLDPSNMKFDVILLCQTIDHLLDASGSLRKIHSLLNPSGILFVDIVDLRAAYLRNRSVESAIKIDHPYYFTETSIAAYLKRFGFEVMRTDYAADHLHIGYVCRRAKEISDFMPDPGSVARFFEEIRTIQNYQD